MSDAPLSNSGSLDLPPLLSDIAVMADVDPMEAAQSAAAEGVDAGTVFWSLRDDRVEAAMVLAPEAPLRRALTVVYAMQQGVTDAIGALGPPEISALWAWPDALILNGARVGRMRAASQTDDLGATPDWLIVALSLRRLARGRRRQRRAAGDETSFAEEGLGDLTTPDLTAAWARHALYWITRWDEGRAPAGDA